MTSHSMKPGSNKTSAPAPEPARKSVTYLIIFSGILIVGLLFAFRGMNRESASAGGAKSAPEKLILKPAPARSKAMTHAPGLPPATTSRPVAPADPASTAIAAPVAPPPPRAEPSPQTRQLVGSLAQIGLGRGVLTKEQADYWKQNFQQLVQQGAASVPAIREFLEKNQDLNFAETGNASQLGYASLRLGLIDALQQIGGPEALNLSLDILQSTADPAEIAQLARNLEAQAPGQYRQEALNAARDTLAMAAKGDLGKRDVAPLFQLMQSFGDSNVIPDLEKNMTQWKYYSTIALATLPEGQGVPSLIHQISDPNSPVTTRNDFALEMLAQVSFQYPEARDALLEQAKLNKITDSGWRRIASTIARDVYQVGAAPTPVVPGMMGYHIESGNQNFYSLPMPTTGADEKVAQRVALIDQLLGVNSSPAAMQALQSARTTLTSGKR